MINSIASFLLITLLLLEGYIEFTPREKVFLRYTKNFAHVCMKRNMYVPRKNYETCNFFAPIKLELIWPGAAIPMSSISVTDVLI